jgi:hypothetical protein
MLKKQKSPPEQVCEPPSLWNLPALLAGASDYAASAGMSAFTCIEKKLCPICGGKGGTEHYYGEHPQAFFFCDDHKTHIFEFDRDEQTADRVAM